MPVALITRSTGLAGRATALQLAADGFDVAISDDPVSQLEDGQSALIGLQREIQSMNTGKPEGVRCEAFVCDLLEEESVKRLIEDVVSVMGGLDVMFVNVLDYSTRFAPTVHTSADDWDRTFAVNTRPTFMCYKHAAAQMIKQGRGGRLVVRFSTPGIQGAHFTDVSALTASMFAMRGLSQAAALELAPHNITVNMVVHGMMDDSDEGPYGYKHSVEKYDRLVQELYPSAREDVQNTRQIMATRTPLPQKNASGQDIARVVALLASADNNFMTGQSIVVDGGIVMH